MFEVSHLADPAIRDFKYPQVLAHSIAHRSLFPEFYKAVMGQKRYSMFPKYLHWKNPERPLSIVSILILHMSAAAPMVDITLESLVYSEVSSMDIL